jgi:fumarylacetoacetase
MASWVPIQENTDFSLQNLPYCVFSTNESEPAIGVAIGEYVLDLKFLTQDRVFAAIEFNTATLEESTLNSYACLTTDIHRKVRNTLQNLLKLDTPLGDVLRDNAVRRARALVPLHKIKMHLPMTIGDYTDFFVGPHHAQNVDNKTT